MSLAVSPRVLLLVVGASLLSSPAAQVHYHEDGRPWKRKVRKGPDAEVPGWYYNLGITGLRVELVADAPTELVVRYVFSKTPAAKKLRVGDRIVGAAGRRFETPHRNGYGMDKFGAHGPIADFAAALDASQDPKRGKGRLRLTIRRGDKVQGVELRVGTKYGPLAKSFPLECKKSARMRNELLAYVAKRQRPNGSWGTAPVNTFAALALLASGKPKYRKLVERNVRFHAKTTKAVDRSSLINWRYMAAAIVMSEYYLATKQRWVLDELQEVYDFLVTSQYTDPSQIDRKTREKRTHDLPKKPGDAHGGWGHNPGFEGYGPICMITGQGALALSLMKHCGIDVDRELHDYAYAFLARGTGRNGYVWYEDKAAGHNKWADMGRTGAAGIANALSPYADSVYKKRALAHARVIGRHPESFPDTHGSPLMGMGYAVMAAQVDPSSLRRLLDANRWWFTLAHCPDGSFYYQPNRDNAGYGADSRLAASAVTAFVLSVGERSLHVTGKPFRR